MCSPTPPTSCALRSAALPCFGTVPFHRKGAEVLSDIHMKFETSKTPLLCAFRRVMVVVLSACNYCSSEPCNSCSRSPVQVLREDEFAPVKNAPGAAADSPDTARKLLLDLGRRYVEAAGGKVEGGGGVEVSPLVSFSGEGLAELLAGTGGKVPALSQLGQA
mmetsp:Transcript_85863/g.228906  ORF Transcript_85863/g.228906 Transcript_85863/m.228906 type:complete len:162 (+) Transcript_85863:97-582(+)